MNRPYHQISFSSIFFDATEKKQNGQLSPRRTIRMREWLALIEWMMSQAAQVDALMTELGLTEPQVLIFWITRKLSLGSGQVKDIMHLNFQMTPPLVAVDH